MRKHIFSLILLLALSVMALSGCNLIKGANDEGDSKDSSNSGNTFRLNDISVKLNDITLTLNDTRELPESVVIGGEEKVITYTFPGSAISIENYVLKGLVKDSETTVTATAGGFVGKFKVDVKAKAETETKEPEINIAFIDVTLDKGDAVMLVKAIKIDGMEKALSYTFEGSNISIADYKLTANKYDTTTAVTVRAEGFEASFNVTVGGDKGTMTVDAPEKIYTNYAPKPITVTFSNPAFASEVTYTASDSRVAFKDGGIYATGAFDSATNVTVTAKSEYHTQTFTVNVSSFNKDNAETKVQYYENNIIKAENKGGTIFIGDSYFDGYKKESPPFWSDFYTDYTDGKTFLMGISSSQIDTWEIVSERIVYPMEPSEIVFHIGFNDTYHSSNSAYEIASRIIALLEEFCAKLPNTKIYYCSVEPKKNALTDT